MAEPCRQLVQRDSRPRQIVRVGITGDQLVALRAMSGETDDDGIVRIAAREALERSLNSGAGGLLVGKEGSCAAECVAEQCFKCDGITPCTAQPVNVGGSIPVDPDENAMKR